MVNILLGQPREYCYLLDSNGNLIKEMPLYGQGLFNISDTDNDGQMNLVVGNGIYYLIIH